MTNKLKVFYICFFLVSAFSFSWANASAEDPKRSAEATEEVQDFLADHKIRKIKNYCTSGAHDCIAFVFFTNAASSNNINSFEVRHSVSTEAGTSAQRTFFIEKDNGQFKMYVQNSFANTITIDSVPPLNQDLSVDFSETLYLPSFELKFDESGSFKKLKYNALSTSDLEIEDSEGKTQLYKYLYF